MTESETMLHTQQITRGDEVVGLRRARLRLTVERGPDRKQRIELAAERVLIGTHARCDLVLSDPAVSRQHCEIALVPTGYAIRDLDSTNGTRIGELAVREVITSGEVRLTLAATVVRMTPLADTEEIPLADATRFGALVGRSVAMRQVFERLARLAPTETTVLIRGESGTGKELAARALHDASTRARGPFVVVDCGALPANLIESELYGHERGAFTGAVAARAGAFERASGGTLFLDELGELPLELQTRLLGAIERRQVQRVGGAAPIPIDVRVVAATHRDLRREVNRGGFREDLYFRIAVVTIEMPALRERPEDIPLYVDELLRDAPGLHIDAATIEALTRQPWPGNVRELRNAIERAAALGEVEVEPARAAAVSLPSVGGEVDVAIPFKTGKAALIEQYERRYCESLLAAHDDNITQAARSAEIDRVYLLRLLDKYGMRPGRR